MMEQEHEFISLYKKLKMNKIEVEVMHEWLGSHTSDSWLAMYEFGVRKDKKIVNAIIESIGSNYSWIKKTSINPITVSVIHTLGLIGDRSAVDVLLKMFNQLINYEMHEYKWIIAWALGEIGDVRALQQLQKALKKDNYPMSWSIGDCMSNEWQDWLVMNGITFKMERTRFDKGPVKSMPDEFLDDIEMAYLSYVQQCRSDFVNEMVSPIEKAINKIIRANKGKIKDNNLKSGKKASIKKAAKKSNSTMKVKKTVKKSSGKKPAKKKTVKKTTRK